MGPDWLGSPHHVIGGMAVALVAAEIAARWVRSPWLLFSLGAGAAAFAEGAFEVAEYAVWGPLQPYSTAYYDTIADLAASLAGGVAGALIAALRPRAAFRR